MSTPSSAIVESAEPRGAGMSRSGLLLQRIQAEFAEMPGLTLTLPQAARLWGLPAVHTKAVLDDLVARGFLMRDSHGSYRRRGCPRCS